MWVQLTDSVIQLQWLTEWMIIIWLQVIGLFLTQNYNVASEDFEYDDV